MKKKTIGIITVSFLGFILIAGMAYADQTIQGTLMTDVLKVSTQSEVTGTGIFDSIKIGKQGTGGVTFFNGSIINNTTTDGVDNPVTFADNVRIDGRIQRGHNKPTDGWNVIIDDGLEINKTLTVSGETNLKGGLKFDAGVAPAMGAAAAPVANFSGAQILGLEAGEVGAYTKGETDTKLGTKANSADVYTKSQVNTSLAAKANSADVYTKTQSNNNYVSKSFATWAPIEQTKFISAAEAISTTNQNYTFGAAAGSPSTFGLYTGLGAPNDVFIVPLTVNGRGLDVKTFSICAYDNLGGGGLQVTLYETDVSSGAGTTTQVTNGQGTSASGVECQLVDNDDFPTEPDNKRFDFHVDFQNNAAGANLIFYGISVVYETIFPR